MNLKIKMKNLRMVKNEFNRTLGGAVGPLHFKSGHAEKETWDFISTSITKLLEELRENDIGVREKTCSCDGRSACNKCISNEEVLRVKIYNQRNQILNSKIDKILNNK